ncbi:hypothetical protein [Thermomonospora cellulosilytica]|uniref:Uncharacterized protein n=1 Tax=Thermomonospora cellulosilytica TaxID=1411118 RepID=A0A7W3MX50_9ACTN|nr:hypothetical protein [Thermomonospora cellulosilytica]MBA9003442.1 hypothetical protein [Thermomonospora cellulosilytica]
MLARQYGYAITPRPAAQMTPWAIAELPSSRWIRIPLWITLFVIALLLGLCILGWSWAASGGGGSALLAIIAFVGPVGLLIIAVEVQRAAKANRRLVRTMSEMLQREPWQAWPCRIERVGEGGGARVEVRVSLLAPDHSVAGRHRARFRPEAWHAMTDGYGVLLFAGDLRFNGVIADPRTRSAYLTDPVEEEARPQGPGNSVIEDELTRQAIGWVFSQ